MLHLVEIEKRYGDAVALHPTTLDVAAGRTAVLIGPSGCGKSTLLRLAIGLIEPTGGSVAIGGERLTAANVHRLRRRVGYVIQDGGLFPHLTARQNVALLPRRTRWPQDRCDARMAELADMTRLPVEVLDRYPVQLSGGQRQRVSLMRALMLDPPLLLLDEPMGALDPMIRADLQEQLRDIFRSLDKTVLMVTHDLAEAAYLADEVVLLQGGRVVQQASVDDLLHRPADGFVTRFVAAQRRELLGA